MIQLVTILLNQIQNYVLTIYYELNVFILFQFSAPSLNNDNNNNCNNSNKLKSECGLFF